MCCPHFRHEIVQSNGNTVKKVKIINVASSLLKTFSKLKVHHRETLAQMKQVPHHANELRKKSAMTIPRRGSWPSPKHRMHTATSTTQPSVGVTIKVARGRRQLVFKIHSL